MIPSVDPKSVGSHCLCLYAGAVPLSQGTGFIVAVGGIHLLLTAFHVLSGRKPVTREVIDIACPDRVLIPFLAKGGPGLRWRPIVQRLLVDGTPTWIEHPRHGSLLDVVALPVEIAADIQVFPYAREPGPDFALLPGSEVAIVGFPEGMSGAGITALWKSGSVASELDLQMDDADFFWIDSNTRRGMSGSPVVARRFGGAMMRNGAYTMGGVSDRILGVYSGRAFDAPDMTLGQVWKWTGVQEIIDNAILQVRRGQARVHMCSLGYARKDGNDMVKINLSMSASVKTPNPNGTVQARTITVADVLSDFVLNDARFGATLETVKMAAEIAAAIEDAKGKGGELELEDARYRLVCDVIEKPSAPYQPIVARQIVALLEEILSAGRK